MRTALSVILMMLVSACASGRSDSAICDALGVPILEHADALLDDGGPRSIQTGERLVRVYDAGCEV